MRTLGSQDIDGQMITYDHAASLLAILHHEDPVLYLSGPSIFAQAHCMAARAPKQEDPTLLHWHRNKTSLENKQLLHEQGSEAALLKLL
jgi:hypothetical protein